MPIKLLVCDDYEGSAIAQLSAQLECEVRRSQDLRPNDEELKSCEGLLIRSRTKVNTGLLNKAPKLRFVVSATSGFDHIDYKECLNRGITVSFTPESNVDSAAELTLSLMLALTRKLPSAMASIAKNKWRTEDLRGHTLSGKNLGIVGLGRIGQKVARAAHALGMNILACDPYQENGVFTECRASRKALTELLILSDVVTLHVPLTKETKHLLNHQTFRVINPEAVVINVSRGAVIQESELIVALQEKLIRGCALDVFEWEPLALESKLRGFPQAILTPHMGAFTVEALEQASMQAVDQTIEFFRTGQCSNSLPLQTAWFEQILNE